MPLGRRTPDRELNIVTSGLSRRFTRGGVTVQVQIYWLETDAVCTLEIVNSKGAPNVWDDLFSSDDAANEKFLRTVADEGMVAFLDSAKVVPFCRQAGDVIRRPRTAIQAR